MRRNSPPRLLMLPSLLMLLLLPRFVQAKAADVESFNDGVDSTLAALDGGHGWSTAWTPVGSGALKLRAGSLHDSGGKLEASGQSLLTPLLTGANLFAEGRRKSRFTFLGQDNRVLYVGFLLMPADTVGKGSQGGFGGLLLGEPGQPRLMVGRPKGAANDFYGLADSAGGGVKSSAAKARKGDPVLIVVRAAFKAGADEFRMYVNPVPGDSEPTTASATKEDLDLGAFGTLAIQAGGTWVVDEVRTGLAYADVVPAQRDFLEIPVTVKVLKNVNITKANAMDIVKEANALLKQVHIRLEFDGTNFEKDYLGNQLATAGEIVKSEYRKVDDPLAAEMDRKKADGGFDGKGVALVFANEINNKNATLGLAKLGSWFKPVIYLRSGQTDHTAGQTVVHEMGHIFGMKEKAEIDRVLVADADGHHPRARCNIMFEFAKKESDFLSARQIDSYFRIAKIRAQVKAKDVPAVDPKPDRQSSWHDRAGDAACSCIDLEGGTLYAPNPDDTLDVRIRVAALLEDLGEIHTGYDVYFDADGNPGTGLAGAPLPGADAVLSVALDGFAPFRSPAGTYAASLRHIPSNVIVPLVPGGVDTVTVIADTDSTDTPTLEPLASELTQPLPVAVLGSLAPDVPFVVLATRYSNGVPVERDTSDVQSLRLRPLPGARLTISPLYAPPGAPLFVSGTGFTPGADIPILIDGLPLGLAHADGAGSFATAASVPAVPQDYYFISAADSRADDFDFSILDIQRAESPVALGDLVSLELGATTDELRLRWRVADAASFASFQVWRGEGNEAPRPLAEARVSAASATSSAGDAFQFRDARVMSGRNYTYQVEALHRDGSRELWPTRVTGELPAAVGTLALRLMSASPLPRGQHLDLMVDVPETGGPVTLDLFDVAGRRVGRLLESPVSPGRSRLTFAAARLDALSGGVYWLRLASTRRATTERLVLAR